MALRISKFQLLATNQLIRLSTKLVSKDVSVERVDPVEHKEVVYESPDNPVKVVEKKTHTKQMWEKDDFRLARYLTKEKTINEQFAIDLIADQPIIKCKERVVSCDGGSGALGHPRVFINLDQSDEAHACGYCGLRFQLDAHHH